MILLPKHYSVDSVILLRLLVICTLFLISSCENPFNPAMEYHLDLNGQQRSNRTPREVLENLEIAYNQKDIELFKNILSKDFRFELLSVETSDIGIDMDGDGIKDSWWDYETEVQYHRNLFERGSSDGSLPAPDEIYLNLIIPHEDIWQLDDQEGREGWVIIPCTFELLLTIYNYRIMRATGYARFYLKPKDNEWRIAIWRDESNI